MKIAACVLVVLVCMANVVWATPEVEFTQSERLPVKIGECWYMFASDLNRAIGSVGIWNDDEKALTITRNDHSIMLVIGSVDAMVYGDSKYYMIKLERASWIDDGHVVVPVEQTVEALGLGLGIEEKKGAMIIMTGTASIIVPLVEYPKWMAAIVSERKLELYQGPWLCQTIAIPVDRKTPNDYRKMAPAKWVEPTMSVQVVGKRTELRPWREIPPRPAPPLRGIGIN